MSESEGVTETQLNGSPPPGESATASSDAQAASSNRTGTILIATALSALVALAVTVVVLRTLWRRRPSDETTERIQSLIDEANRLIRTLEEKK